MLFAGIVAAWSSQINRVQVADCYRLHLVCLDKERRAAILRDGRGIPVSKLSKLLYFF